MFLKDLKVKSNVEISKDNYLMTFSSKEIAENSKIGQFLEIKLKDGKGSLLRKPISINNVNEDEITILYKVVGKGTKAMSECKDGEEISVLGPLGNGFPEIEDKELLLVAGGIGYGPFTYIMRKFDDFKLFFGFREEGDFVYREEVEELIKSGKAFVTTNDGSCGRKGFITEELDEYLAKDSKNKVILTCGPTVMMKAVRDVADKYGVETFISLEEYMGCGIGACVGCAQKIKSPEKKEGWEYKKVCVDGPVFKGSDILWD